MRSRNFELRRRNRKLLSAAPPSMEENFGPDRPEEAGLDELSRQFRHSFATCPDAAPNVKVKILRPHCEGGIVMNHKRVSLLFVAALAVLPLPLVATAQVKITEGLAGSQGSTVGPDGALYVTEGMAGRISRVDPWTGEAVTYATGLPTSQIIPGVGGAVDVAFIDGVAYALVTMVDGCFGGPDTAGIYQMESSDEFSVVADLGTFSADNPPVTPFDLPCGVQYAMEPAPAAPCQSVAGDSSPLQNGSAA
jgi:hypothetical protein